MIAILLQSGSNTIKALMWNDSGCQQQQSSTERVKDRVPEVRASAKKKSGAVREFVRCI